MLDHARHALRIEDAFSGAGEHSVAIPLHLAPDVEAQRLSSHSVLLKAGGKTFLLEWASDAEWTLEMGQGRLSPRYGVVVPAARLLWRHCGALAALTMTLSPIDVPSEGTASDTLGVEPAA